MRKEDKSTVIEQIAATVKQYAHFYLVDTTAMDATATSALRRECFKAGIKLMVVKNSLLHKALEGLEEDYSPPLWLHERYNSRNVLRCCECSG